MGRATQEGHYYHCMHNRLPYNNSLHREMLQSTNRLQCSHIIIQVFHLQKIEDCYKTPIQPTTTKLNTADGSPVSAIGTMALHLRITEFKCHKLCNTIQHELYILLKEYESQFAKDETSIGTTPLTSMTIDTVDSDSISQKPYPITMKHYQWVKVEIEKLLAA